MVLIIYPREIKVHSETIQVLEYHDSGLQVSHLKREVLITTGMSLQSQTWKLPFRMIPCTSHSTKDKTIRTENKSMVIGLGMWTGDWLPKGHRKLQENNKKCSISLLFCWLHDCTYLSKLTFTRVNFAICKLCLTKPTYKRSDGICQAY